MRCQWAVGRQTRTLIVSIVKVRLVRFVSCVGFEMVSSMKVVEIGKVDGGRGVFGGENGSYLSFFRAGRFREFLDFMVMDCVTA